MTIKHVASIAALALLAGAPALAFAASDPIAIDNVQTTPAYYTYASIAPDDVRVAFRNTSDVSATVVVFELDVNGREVERVADRGTFAPGVAIRHTFETLDVAGNPQIKVVAVRFADGDSWTDGTQSE